MQVWCATDQPGNPPPTTNTTPVRSNMLGCGRRARKTTAKRHPPAQCNGATKAGCRCSITPDCELKDSSGARASEPLLHGEARCLFHTEIFTYLPSAVKDGMVFFLDFETTGLVVMKHHIVEIGVHGGNAMP